MPQMSCRKWVISTATGLGFHKICLSSSLHSEVKDLAAKQRFLPVIMGSDRLMCPMKKTMIKIQLGIVVVGPYYTCPQ